MGEERAAFSLPAIPNWPQHGANIQVRGVKPGTSEWVGKRSSEMDREVVEVGVKLQKVRQLEWVPACSTVPALQHVYHHFLAASTNECALSRDTRVRCELLRDSGYAAAFSASRLPKTTCEAELHFFSTRKKKISRLLLCYIAYRIVGLELYCLRDRNLHLPRHLHFVAQPLELCYLSNNNRQRFPTPEEIMYIMSQMYMQNKRSTAIAV